MVWSDLFGGVALGATVCSIKTRVFAESNTGSGFLECILLLSEYEEFDTLGCVDCCSSAQLP